MRRILYILIMCAMAAMTAMAQDATVRSFGPAMSDLTAAKYSRLDNNGIKCAVVKVRVIAANVQFQGGIIEPVEKKPGEYWVYMPQNEQRVLVMSDDFKPLMVEFGEPLQASVTYILDLETPQRGTAGTQKPKMSFLVLKVSPATARVTVDGTELPVNNGVARKALDDGEHSYVVEALGYAPERGNVTIAGKRQEVTVSLRSTKPILTVESSTPGTEIYVNEVRQGVDRWSGELIADSYLVEGKKTGYRTVSEAVALGEGEKRSIKLPALEAITGSVSVDYEPVGAKISIDGKQAGVSPDVINDVLVGAHKVAVSADGYATAELNVTVTEGETASVSGRLEAATAPQPVTAEIAEGEEKNFVVYHDENGKAGYKYNEKIVIPAKFDSTHGFDEGMASVRINDKWGSIDRYGNLVIPAIYSDSRAFSEGLKAVQLNGKWGYVNKKGEVVIPLIYGIAESFHEGKARVRLDGRAFYIDKNGKEIDETAPAGEKKESAVSLGSARMIRVKGFGRSPEDLSALVYAQKDSSGKRCALVKVIIPDIVNLKFKGNITSSRIRSNTHHTAGGEEYQRIEYWVYLPQGETKMAVEAKDNFPVNVEFGEPLQAGITYELQLAPMI